MGLVPRLKVRQESFRTRIHATARYALWCFAFLVLLLVQAYLLPRLPLCIFLPFGALPSYFAPCAPCTSAETTAPKSNQFGTPNLVASGHN